MRDYQIPNNPKHSYSTTTKDSVRTNVSEILFNRDIPKTSREMGSYLINDLKDLFESTKPPTRLSSKTNSVKGILKKRSYENINVIKPMFETKETEILKNLISTLGLKIDNPLIFISAVNNHLEKSDYGDAGLIKVNIERVISLLDKYQRFKVHLYKGRNRCIMPIYYKTLPAPVTKVHPFSYLGLSPILPSPAPINLNVSPPFNLEDKSKIHPKWKTVPCIYYHGSRGCTLGDKCDFIHNPKFKGRQVPEDVRNDHRPNSRSNIQNPVLNYGQDLVENLGGYGDREAPLKHRNSFTTSKPAHLTYDPIKMRTQMFEDLRLNKRTGYNPLQNPQGKKFKLN